MNSLADLLLSPQLCYDWSSRNSWKVIHMCCNTCFGKVMVPFQTSSLNSHKNLLCSRLQIETPNQDLWILEHVLISAFSRSPSYIYDDRRLRAGAPKEVFPQLFRTGTTEHLWASLAENSFFTSFLWEAVKITKKTTYSVCLLEGLCLLKGNCHDAAAEF